MKSKIIKITLGCIGLVVGIFLGLTTTKQFSTGSIKTPKGIVHAEATVTSPQGVNISVLVANTEQKRVSCLSGFPALSTKQGMLFVFPQMGIYPFWMKDMNFPIDIVWIDHNDVVIDRAINVTPDSYPKTFVSKGPAVFALELSANHADKYGFAIGSHVKIQNNK